MPEGVGIVQKWNGETLVIHIRFLTSLFRNILVAYLGKRKPSYMCLIPSFYSEMLYPRTQFDLSLAFVVNCYLAMLRDNVKHA